MAGDEQGHPMNLDVSKDDAIVAYRELIDGI